MQNKIRPTMPLIMLFLIINSFLLVAKSWCNNWGIDREVLIIANLLFFAISLIAFLLQSNALKNSNPHAFVRSVMGGMMIKMAVVVIAVIIYAMLSGNNFNKPAVFIALALYVIYLVTEVGIVMKLNKKTNA